ncbi:uncharacterized protein LOC126627907 [Malus sylvestris]|uniref:uncharacterized protein LOC126627907 n=1 Tax=Malus sylvestris TaxID=3752 RepID=UPI0021ABC122|nr:uncharacterized protein LOC126627907 [Malus sylvestris]
MVVAKKKLVPLPRKATTVTHSLVEPTLVVAPATSTTLSKRLRPEVKTTGNIARPQKRIKIKVSATVPRDHSIPTTGQATVVQPITQAVVVVEPVIILVVEELVTLEVVITPADDGPAAATLEKTTTTTKKNSPPNLKKAQVIVLKKEENESEVPSLVRRSQ